MGYSLNTRYRSVFHEYILTEFIYEAILIVILIIVNVEFHALSKSIVFNRDYSEEIPHCVLVQV